jgi:hypothetical protein
VPSWTGAALEVLESGREVSIAGSYGFVWAAAQWKSAFEVVSSHFRRRSPKAATVSNQSSLMMYRICSQSRLTASEPQSESGR